MKKVFLVFLLALSISVLNAQDIVSQVSAAIKSGNAKELSKYFHTNVELTIVEKEGMYSKSQTQLMVQDFFNQNPPTDFAKRHQNTAKDGSVYMIGELKSKKEHYRTYILFKTINGVEKIQTIRFETD
jgi:hypothetical protein